MIELDDSSIASCGSTKLLSATDKNSSSNLALSASTSAIRASCSCFFPVNSSKSFLTSSFILAISFLFSSSEVTFSSNFSFLSTKSFTIFLSIFTSLVAESNLDIRSLKLSALNKSVK